MGWNVEQQVAHRAQVAALTELQQQHRLTVDHAGAVKLHDVLVVADGLEDADFLQRAATAL